jgi:hypothetical protein
MRFKQYLAELHNIEPGQAIHKHETPTDNSISIHNPKIRGEINVRLAGELDKLFISPEQGIQSVRKVLNRYSMDVPALYDADHEGDEIVLQLDQFGKVLDFVNPQVEETGQYYLYLIYYLTDDGNYEFYSEITDEEGLNEIMSDEEEEKEEE